ncbi:hypothetical protein [Deinococcus sp. RIT780]|uniref:hypothetical protein n=1 Tax=Deinococcus sp. RIT780 TaxID=2870472 RepID=UPI001C8A280E|nr:hypothetical protein [Deinococcus sp. RIT780]MBX8464396.1 hypothetical protein [Deinococcus sp. RIT780]
MTRSLHTTKADICHCPLLPEGRPSRVPKQRQLTVLPCPLSLATVFQNFGVQRFDFNSGITEAYLDERQPLNCRCQDHPIATADMVVD